MKLRREERNLTSRWWVRHDLRTLVRMIEKGVVVDPSSIAKELRRICAELEEEEEQEQP